MSNQCTRLGGEGAGEGGGRGQKKIGPPIPNCCFFFFFYIFGPPPRPPQASRGGLEAASLGSPWPPNSRMRGETLEFLNSLILQFQTSPSLTIFCNIITVLRFPNASLLHVTLARSQSSTVIMHGKCNSKEANKMDKPMIFVLASRMACYKTKLLLQPIQNNTPRYAVCSKFRSNIHLRQQWQHVRSNTDVKESQLIKSDRQAFLSYLYSEYGQNDTKRNKSGDAVLELCMHMLHATYREAMRNMETGSGNTCIAYKVLVLQYTGIHVCYREKQDLYNMLIGNKVAPRLYCKRCDCGWPTLLLKVHSYGCCYRPNHAVT